MIGWASENAGHRKDSVRSLQDREGIQYPDDEEIGGRADAVELLTETLLQKEILL